MAKNAGKTPGRPFKKGNPGGPGRPPMPPEIKEARSFDQKEMILALNKFLFMTIEQLEIAKGNPQNTFIEIFILKTFLDGQKKGSFQVLNFLFDRLVGKPKETIAMDLSSKDGSMTPTAVLANYKIDKKLFAELVKIDSKLEKSKSSSD